MSVDTTPVVGPVVQRLVARRLGAAGITLGCALALGLLEIALLELPAVVHASTLAGVVLCGASLGAVGFRSVRRAFGDPLRPWMRLASASAILPFLFGCWLLVFRGLRAFAVSGGPAPVWAVFALWAWLGFRLLADTVKVSEMGRLARTMIVPAPGEPGRGGYDAGPGTAR